MQSINPYAIGANIIWNRMKWDTKQESWRSRKKLQKIKSKHAGESLVIVCNGPSLNEINLEQTRSYNVKTIALNKINLLFDKTSWRPDYVVAMNPLVLQQNKEFFNETDIPLFLDQYALKCEIESRENTFFLHSTPIKGVFAEDCSFSVYQGYTVTFVAMQIGYHLGFRNVALVGCDHNFHVSGKPNEEKKAPEFDKNHFSSEYFSGNMTWNLPDLFESEISYARALKKYRECGGEIFNCTVGGYLEVFPRLRFSEFLEKFAMK